MNPNDVGDEIAEKLDTIAGLRVSAYPPPTVTPPSGVVGYPEQIEFDLTYGRGMDRIPDWPVMVVVGKATDRTARERIFEYAAGTGAKSVKAVLEAATYTSLDELRVTGVEFDVVTIASVDYIAAVFHLDIAGQGA